MTSLNQYSAFMLCALVVSSQTVSAQTTADAVSRPALEAANNSVPAGQETSLDKLIEQALVSYPAILSNESLIQAAKYDVNAARLKFFPNVAFSNSFSSLALADQAGSNQGASNLTITQPLYQGGALEAGQSKASAKMLVSYQALREVKQDVARRVITNYGEWLKAYTKILAQQENVQLHEKLVELISSRVKEEVASRADMNLAISRLLTAKADLTTQLSIEKSALNALSQLVGQPVQRADLLNVRATAKALPARDQILEIARLNSPTIQRMTLEAQVTREESKEIRAQLSPQIALQAQVQIGSAVLPNAPNYNTLGLTLNYATGNGFSTVAYAKSAGDRANASELQIQTAHRDLNDRLSSEINEYEFSKIKIESLQKSADLAEEISESYDRQFLVGRKSWLDLMNTVRERAQNKFTLADVEVSLITTSWKIAVALGQENVAPDFTEIPLMSMFK